MNNAYIKLSKIPFSLAPLTLVSGHYGVGKTNFSLNLAYDIRSAGKEVTLIDLDVINPYFRSSDYAISLKEAGISIITPVFAGSNLDVPSLSAAIEPAFQRANENHLLIVDVGGDDVGATSLGRYCQTIKKLSFKMLYVVNAYRNLSQSPEQALQMLKEIEAKAHLRADGIINNSHLKEETNLETIQKSTHFAAECARLSGLEVLATTLPQEVFERYVVPSGDKSCAEPKSSAVLSRLGLQKPYIVQVYVRSPWEQ